MKLNFLFLKVVVLLLCSVKFHSSSMLKNVIQPLDYVKTMGFRCITHTGLETAIRLNDNNEIECFSTDGKNCKWGLNTEKKCMDAITGADIKQLSPIECGVKHKEMFQINGYDNRGHWCWKGLKYFFGKLHCPNESGLKVAVRMNKETGEVRCLSKDLQNCYQGKDLQQLCETTNACKKRKEERNDESGVANKPKKSDEMTHSDKQKTYTIGCEGEWKDKEGLPGYQTDGKHWCKESLAYFRYSSEWQLSSKTKMNNIIRLGEKGDIECLSKDGTSCVEERGGDAKMKSQIDSATNSGKSKPKTVVCKTDEFKDPTKWCYKAYFLVIGKSVPPKPKKPQEKKKPKEELRKPVKKEEKKKKKEKKKPKKNIKIDPKKDIVWRGSVFGPEKDGFNKGNKQSHEWRGGSLGDGKDDKSEDNDNKDDTKKDSRPGWRTEDWDSIEGAEPKKPLPKVGETWRTEDYLDYNKGKDGKGGKSGKEDPKKGGKQAASPEQPKVGDVKKPVVPASNPPASTQGSQDTYEIVCGKSNKCLDVVKGDKKPGSSIIQYACNKGESQKWTQTEKDSAIIFTNVNSGLVLTVEKDSQSDGAKLVQDKNGNKKTQQFRIKRNSDGSTSLTVAANEKCIDVSGGSVKDEAEIIQWKCHYGPNQQWKINKLPGTPQPKVSNNNAPGKDNATGKDGKDNKPDPNKKEAPKSGEVYAIKTSNKLCVGVRDGSQRAGSNMVETKCNNKSDQKFEISHSKSHTLILRVQSTGLAVSIWGGGIHEMANLVQNNYEGQKYQEFLFKKQKDGTYEIKAAHTNKCLQIESTVNAPYYANIYQITCKNVPIQRFTLEKIAGKEEPEKWLQPDNEQKKPVNNAGKDCVTLYKDINFGGDKKEICGEVGNFVSIGWNDAASSVKVPKGIKVDLYWDVNYKGKKLSLTQDTPDFVKLGWNDQASSAKIYKAPEEKCVTMYEDIEYKGKEKKICGEVANFVQIGWNDKASSVKIPKGTQVEFYWDINYKGKKLTLKQDTPNFVKLGWNDKASSAKVLVATDDVCVTMYQDVDYKGDSKEICGDVPNFGDQWVNKASSVKVPAGSAVEFYSSIDFKDNKIVLIKDTPNFVPLGWNDKASSARVKKTDAPQNPELKPGLYTIVNLNSGLCVNIMGGSKNDGAEIIQWQCTKNDNQKHEVKYTTENTAVIIPRSSNKNWNIKDGSTDKGAQLIQWKPENGAKNAEFIIKKDSGVFIIKNVKSHKCLDIREAAKIAGARLVQMDCNGSGSQKFKFVPV